MRVGENDIEATVLVLQKTPYIGGKLIVDALSPERGKMAFFVRGTGNSRNAAGQPFDLFRVLNVTCHRNSGDLYYPDSVEIAEDFSGVAADYETFDTACALARFASLHIMPGLPSGNFFTALVVALRRLNAHSISLDAAVTGCQLVFLYEAGSLDYGNATPKEAAQHEILINMALGAEVPQLAPEVWRRLREWSESLVARLGY